VEVQKESTESFSMLINIFKTELPLFSAGFRGVVYPSSLDSTDENMFKSVAEAFYLVCVLDAVYIMNCFKFNFTDSLYCFQQSQAFQEPQACDVSRTRQRKRSKQRRPAVTGQTEA